MEKKAALEHVLLRPRITEKAALMTSDGVYVFNIALRATKKDVSESIQAIYNVVPRKIRIVRSQPRKKISRMRGRFGQTKAVKKAYVYLKKDDHIEII